MTEQFARTYLLLGKEGLERLRQSTVAVFGVGGVGGYAVEALARTGAQVTWAYHRRVPDVGRFGDHAPTVVSMDGLPDALAAADIVLSAVDSAQPVVTADMRSAVADRNVLFVDLGVPRNIDPFYDDWGHGVTVADLDDLKLWHRVKTGVLNEVRTKADAVIRAEYRSPEN